MLIHWQIGSIHAAQMIQTTAEAKREGLDPVYMSTPHPHLPTNLSLSFSRRYFCCGSQCYLCYVRVYTVFSNMGTRITAALCIYF